MRAELCTYFWYWNMRSKLILSIFFLIAEISISHKLRIVDSGSQSSLWFSGSPWHFTDRIQVPVKCALLGNLIDPQLLCQHSHLPILSCHCLPFVIPCTLLSLPSPHDAYYSHHNWIRIIHLYILPLIMVIFSNFKYNICNLVVNKFLNLS